MKRIRITILLLGAVVLILIVGRLWMLRRPAIVHESPKPQNFGRVQDFTLVNQSGQPFGLNDLKGKVWVADFFFTQCMGPCPLLTTKMAELQSEFKDKPGLAFVSFSVDPEHDTPAALSKYANTYGADLKNWTFVTGPKEKIYKLIRESFHLAVEPRGNEGPSMNDVLHSLFFVLVDKEGNILRYTNTSDVDAMKDLKSWLSTYQP